MPGIAIVADTHTHTVASPHAYGTIRENLDAARRMGHRALAVTDHGPAIPDSPHLWHFTNMRILPREVDGVVLLRGIEANLMDRQGTLDVDDDLLRRLDWVIASLHPPVFPPSTPADHTEAWLGVLANPWVDVLGHPGDPSYPCDYETVVRACGRAGTCIEINNGSFRVRPGSEPKCRTLAALCPVWRAGGGVFRCPLPLGCRGRGPGPGPAGIGRVPAGTGSQRRRGPAAGVHPGKAGGTPLRNPPVNGTGRTQDRRRPPTAAAG